MMELDKMRQEVAMLQLQGLQCSMPYGGATKGTSTTHSHFGQIVCTPFCRVAVLETGLIPCQ